MDYIMQPKLLTPKYKWYLNRLRTMTFLEIACRAKTEAMKNLEQLLLRDIDPPPVLPCYKDISWYFALTESEKVFSFMKDRKLWNEDKALELLEHKFSFFSFKNSFLSWNIDWHRDYKNNKRAPLTYSKKINYRNFSEAGDIKYIWEPNRHQHLVSLAKAFYLTGSQKYKDEVIEQIKPMDRRQPVHEGR